MELLSELCQAQGLTETLGVGAAEVALLPLLEVAALLLANHDHRIAVQARQAPDDRFVVRGKAVAAHLQKIVEDKPDIVERVGAVAMTRHKCLFPRGEVPVYLHLQLQKLFLKDGKLGGEFNPLSLRFRDLFGRFQLADELFELGDGLFEIEDVI